MVHGTLRPLLAKRCQGDHPPAPKARWAHLSQVWPPISIFPKVAKRTPGPTLAMFNPWPLAATRAKQVFPSIQGKNSPSPMYSIPKDSGMVHIWYNIPLCTNFSQQSNGDAFRTKLCLFNSSPQIHDPFGRISFQSFSLGFYQKTIQGPQPPGPAGVGL
ncbi:hypothetical protein O181_011511 [Austropuccinia psidii MF-1]|uniref:Uncharacterized protein n=1 Tax=Austropuccinia psidii MF-1 TaxID=1389203 RepID=A0A9Q3BSY0_9BASI|nr:hypothetical protein [Austropuccinia psidii MF-1]